jgi:hypothetical protein
MATKVKKTKHVVGPKRIVRYRDRDAELVKRILTPDPMSYYCYILVRRDLPLPVQTVQAAHAAQEVGYNCPRPPSPTNFVVLGVSGEAELKFYSELLKEKELDHILFFEPDYNTGNTALCTYPIKGKIDLLKHLTLLGKPC